MNRFPERFQQTVPENKEEYKMNKVTFPLKPKMQGQQVADLQQALNLFLEKGTGLKLDEASRKKLSIALMEEYKKQFFGGITKSVLMSFQQGNHIDATGEVDEKTAAAINRFIEAQETKSKPQPDKKKSELSFLLKPDLGVKTGLSIKSFEQEQFKFLESKFKDYLEKAAIGIRDGIIEKLPGKREAVKNIFDRLDGFELSEIIDQSLGEVISSFINKEDKKFFNDDELKSIRESLGINAVNKIRDILRLDMPLRDNPIFAKDILKAKAVEYADIIGLTGENLNRFVEKEIDLSNENEAPLEELVKEDILTIVQKDDLLLTTRLSVLVGENFDLIKGIKTEKVKSPVDFVEWEKSDLRQFIIDNKIPIPKDESAETYADNIFFNLEQTYPCKFFFNRLFKSQKRDKLNLLDSLHKLLVNNDKLIDNGKPATIDWKKMSGDNREKLQKDLSDLASFANAFKRLGIVDLINDKSVDLAQKKNTINSRLQSLDTFNKNNPDLDIRFVNFFDKTRENINWTDITEQDFHLVRKQLMAYQRILNVAENTADRQMLLRKGYDSAVAIANETLKSFVANSGMEESSAKMIYAKAQANSVSVANSFETIRDVVRGHFKDLAVSNLSPQLINDLREIDGFADLFNSQDYCDCEDCKSVLSPAAYFVDLMRFIDKYISKHFFANLKDHPLYLKNRRPDLWNQKLTCEATNMLIPYLDIVNEVLETSLGSNIYNILSKRETKISFALPFNLPLEELRIYLGHFDLSLHEIYKLLKLEEEKIWRAKLNISKEEFEVITSKDPGGVKQRFGNPTSLVEFPVQDYKEPQTNSLRRGFIKLISIDREQLDELLAIRYNPDLSRIDIIKKIEPDELQNFPEFLVNLTDERLDFIHRFIRLWKRTPWSVSELDLLLTALAKSYSTVAGGNGVIKSEINSQIVIDIARMISIQEQFKFSVEELCAMVDQLPASVDYPTPPVNEKDKKLFERLFDPSKLFDKTPESSEFYYYLMDENKPNTVSIDQKTPLLLGGSGTSETDLYSLFRLLKNEIIFDANGKCTLNRKVISILYRHAKIAKALGVNIDDLILMLLFKFDSRNFVIRTPEVITQLAEFQEWLKTSPFSLAVLNFILKGEESNSVKYSINLSMVETVVKEIQNDQEDDKVAALKVRLLKMYNISSGLLENVLKWLNTSIEDEGVKTALKTKFNNEGKPENEDNITGLLIFLKEMERILSLFSYLMLKEESIAYVSENYEVLGFNNLKLLTIDNLRALTYFQELILLHDTAEPLLQTILINYDKTKSFSNDIDRLSDLWRLDRSLIDSFSGSNIFSKIPIEAMTQLGKYLNLCKTLGINGYSLQKFADDTQLQEARNIVVGAFKSKYDDEKVRKGKIEPYQDKINVIKRDALCDYIIARERDLKFNDRNDVYAFFLLDVEMGGCFRISRLVAAISSLQLYVHRCLLNLEQSGNQNPNIPDVNVKADDEDFINEWEWRKNYRVWEANRKVFLYPENYLEPDLRDNKTPIFKGLEDELLQQKITRESAEVAYKKYVTQFTELAHLRIVGSYYHEEEEDSVYYFFGRTHIEPYQYYYRKYYSEKILWCPWIKIELAIDADEVSAIINLGKLYLFWTEVQRKEISGVQDGSSTQGGYQFKVFAKYSYLNENGKWVAPQRIYINSFSASRDQIARRVIHSLNIFDEEYQVVDSKSIVDAKIDDVISKYEKMVFRKPILVKSGQSSNKISIGYIESWVQYCFYNDEKKITTKELLISLNNEPNVDIKPIEFESSNNTYPVIKENVPLLIGGEIFTNGTAYLIGSNTCIYVFNLGTFAGMIPLAIEKIESVSNSQVNIYAGLWELMLQNNKIDEKISLRSNIYHQRLSFLNNEFNLSYVDSKIEQSFVQDGTTTSSENGRIILQMSTNDNYLQTNSQGGGVKLTKLSTPFTDELNWVLITSGIDVFLDIKTQQLLSLAQALHFHGPYGEYYREIFFHIPFLIASHLNANQKFKEAKYWFEKIFNPAGIDKIEPAIKTDRNWRYIEFRNQHIQTMKEILTDQAAIDKYENDPFNPHAIARLRLNAYMKTIVMKYIDNLLDWGDYVFALDTIESINEATMLYVLAADILGNRPVKSGKCEVAADVTYQKLEPLIENDEGSDFLYVLENWWWSNLQYQLWGKDQETLTEKLNWDKKSVPTNKLSGIPFSREKPNGLENMKADILKLEDPGVPYIKHYNKAIKERNKNKEKISENLKSWYNTKKTFPGLEIVRQSLLVFCIPPNRNLLQYWDRVEDRLFKIRHCMNISGVRRQLALFQPSIEPMLLVRAKAAGLSLEDITSKGRLETPYRFSYLVEKARQYTQTLQSFGTALLSALEKKDVEELTLLRSMHERNILRMTRDIKINNVRESARQYQALEESITNIQNRIEYYEGLIKDELSDWERAQQISFHSASVIQATEAIIRMAAAFAKVVPQTGSPFAMTFGGIQLGGKLAQTAAAINTSSEIAKVISASAGLEATFQRREQEWNQQLRLAKQELKQVEQQRLAAEIRQHIAEKDLEIHDTNMDQAAEIYEFYKNKFSNLGLYNFLSTSLNRLYGEAYKIAYELAIMAQNAYRFERDDETIFITGDNWQYDRAGLLAGERLLLQLQKMEKEYIIRNSRDYELIKHVSLSMLDPLALVKLRTLGQCHFEIPEILYDMDFPGQYLRKIKSVSISMPCITGPYTSVSAKLSIGNNRYRKSIDVANGYKEIENDDRFVYFTSAPQSSIATSTSQNESGLFELNFRDERYLPFEGLGAVSDWALELPSEARQFDYNTIADVIIHVKYTAKEGGSDLKIEANKSLKAHLAEIKQELDQTGFHIAINMKHDFPNEWYSLMKNGSTNLKIENSRLPYFAQSLGSKIKNVIFIAKVNGNPDNYNLKIDQLDLPLTKIDDEWQLCKGETSKIRIDAAFNLTASVNGLEELILVAKYSF